MSNQSITTTDLENLARRMRAVIDIATSRGASLRAARAAAMADAGADPRRRDVYNYVVDCAATPCAPPRPTYADFIKEVLQTDAGHTARAADIYNAFGMWWRKHHPSEPEPTMGAVGRALSGAGLKKFKRGGVILYVDVRVRARA